MIIQLESDISEAEIRRLKEDIGKYALPLTEVRTQQSVYLICTGREHDLRFFGAMAGVADVHRVTDSYKLVSRAWKLQTSVVDIGGVQIGNGDCTVMAGPCAIENEAQVTAVVCHLVDNGIRIMRGGVFKPRSSPYTFRGTGMDGLRMWSAICRQQGMRIISEVMEVGQVEQMYDYVRG
jgi:3-deoxy-7-phosphoheptulonate synthase